MTKCCLPTEENLLFYYFRFSCSCRVVIAVFFLFEGRLSSLRCGQPRFHYDQRLLHGTEEKSYYFEKIFVRAHETIGIGTNRLEIHRY